MGRRDAQARPYQRSITTHIRSMEYTDAVNTNIPTLESEGFDVSDWLSIVASVHPTDPDITTVTAGSYVTLKPWRYKKAAQEGTNPGSGQWYAGLNWTVPLDGDGSGDMEKGFAVWDSERFYFQLVELSLSEEVQNQ